MTLRTEQDILDFIRKLDGPGDMQMLLGAMESNYFLECTHAGKRLGELHEKYPLSQEDIQHIVDLLDHEEWAIRTGAANALIGIKCRAAVPALIRNLKDENDQVAIASSIALGAIGDPSAIPVLICAYNNGGLYRWADAARALANFADDRVARVFLETKLNEDGHHFKRDTASEGLTNLIEKLDNEILFDLFLPYFVLLRSAEFDQRHGFLKYSFGEFYFKNKQELFDLLVAKVGCMTDEEKCTALITIIHTETPIIAYEAFQRLQQLGDDTIHGHFFHEMMAAINEGKPRKELEDTVLTYSFLLASSGCEDSSFQPAEFAEALRDFLGIDGNLGRLCAAFRSHPYITQLDADAIIWNLIRNAKALISRDARESARRLTSSRRGQHSTMHASFERAA